MFSSLVIIYSSVKPDDESSGIFCALQVHLLITQLLIFSKIFLRKSIDLYGSIIIAIQIATYYIGMAIISNVSLYEFNGVLSHMFDHKLFLVSIICIWIFLSFDYISLAIFQSFKEINEKKVNNKY